MGSQDNGTVCCNQCPAYPAYFHTLFSHLTWGGMEGEGRLFTAMQPPTRCSLPGQIQDAKDMSDLHSFYVFV